MRGENSGDVIVMGRTKIERQNYSGLQMSITWSNIQRIWSTYVTDKEFGLLDLLDLIKSRSVLTIINKNKRGSSV